MESLARVESWRMRRVWKRDERLPQAAGPL
jgi:hypothetical protein